MMGVIDARKAGISRYVPTYMICRRPSVGTGRPSARVHYSMISIITFLRIGGAICN